MQRSARHRPLRAMSAYLGSDSIEALVSPALPFDRVGLVGRNEEIRVLGELLQNARRQKTVNLLMVSGAAGTGKSALVSQLQPDTSQSARTSILFAMGKFDQETDNLKHALPFCAFVTAFQRLVLAVLELEDTDPDVFARISQSIQREESLLRHALFLETVIPNLDLLLERIGAHEAQALKERNNEIINDDSSFLSTPPVDINNNDNNPHTSIHHNSNKHVLFYLLLRFLRAISPPTDSTLVIVIEDLQWADRDSLDLFTAIATARDITGMLLVGTYRKQIEGEDVVSAASSTQSINHLLRSKNTHHIQLSNLAAPNVEQYFKDLLSSSDEQVSELAAIVHKKTHGNPFFLRQFILSLYDKGLLRIDPGLLRWEFDVAQIQCETIITDDVADLMANRLQNQLPAEARHLLLLASCVGSTFRQSTIYLIFHGLKNCEEATMHDSMSFVAKHLQTCAVEGLLVAGSNADEEDAEYHFAHDNIRIAALSVVSLSERGALQVRMGQVLLQLLSHAEEAKNDKLLFTALDLLIPFIDSSTLESPNLERPMDLPILDLAQLCLEAGRKAIVASATSSSLTYLKAGIALIKSIPEFWVQHRKLSLDLFGYAADASFSIGDISLMQDLLDQVIQNEWLNFDDKLRAYSTLVRSLGTQNKLHEAIDASLDVLAKLGIKFRTKNLALSVLWNLIKTKTMLDKHDAVSLVNLPLMEDTQNISAMRIMDNLINYTYAVNQDLNVLLILKLTRRSVKYGLCRYSPVAFAAFGILIGSVLGDLKRGHMFASVGLKLNKRLGVREMEARTKFIAYNFVLHWTDPLPQSFRPYLRGYQVGLETGDIENAMFCITYHCDVAMHTGRRLSLVVADFAAYSDQMKDYELEYNYQLTIIPWQLALNLMGDNVDDPCTLTGTAMNQEAMLVAGEQVPLLRSFTQQARLCLACYFGQYELAWEIVQATRDLAKTNLGTPVVWRSTLFEGLAIFALARKSQWKGIWKMRAWKVMRRLQQWVSKGNLNCVHIMQLLKAEMAALLGKPFVQVQKAYDLAIASAGRIGFLNDQALGNERAAAYFATIEGSCDSGLFWAEHYLKTAYSLYNEWEAYGKARQLKAQYETRFNRMSSSFRND